MKEKNYAYDQVSRNIDDFLELLNALKIDVPNKSHLENAFCESWEIIEKYQNNDTALLDDNAYEKYANFCALNDYMIWINRIGGAEGLQRHNLVKHISLLKDALVSPTAIADTDHSRKMLELIVALNILPFVDEIDIDDCEHSGTSPQKNEGGSGNRNPDVCFRIGEKWYGIECKTTQTGNVKTIWDDFTNASDQLLNCKKHNLEFGIPLLSCRNANLYKDLFPKEPYANDKIPLGIFKERLMALFSDLKSEDYVNEIKKETYSKTPRGFAVLENIISKMENPQDHKTKIVNMITSDLFIISDDSPFKGMAYKIIGEMNHQIQRQSDLLYFNDKSTANEMVYKTSISDKEMSTFILRACLLLTGPARMNIEIPASDIGKVDSVLPVEIEGKYNVYAIWSNDKLMYIGKSSDIRQRLRNHLFGCSEEIGSKLDLVKKEVDQGRHIFISLVEVCPMQYREAVEERLIYNITAQDSSALPWNIHGRAQ